MVDFGLGFGGWVAQRGFGSWVGVAGIDTHKSKFGLMEIIIIIITTNKLLIFWEVYFSPFFLLLKSKRKVHLFVLYSFKKKSAGEARL